MARQYKRDSQGRFAGGGSVTHAGRSPNSRGPSGKVAGAAGKPSQSASARAARAKALTAKHGFKPPKGDRTSGMTRSGNPVGLVGGRRVQIRGRG